MLHFILPSLGKHWQCIRKQDVYADSSVGHTLYQSKNIKSKKISRKNVLCLNPYNKIFMVLRLNFYDLIESLDFR